MLQIPEFLTYFHIYFWTDPIEILLLSFFVYYFSCWLARDSSHKLIIPWYGYCTLLFLAYVCNFPAISFLLIYFAPASAMLCMLAHQESLQRNFVPFKKITPAMVLAERAWIDMAVQLLLYARSHQKSLTFVIEHHDPLDAYLAKSLTVNTPLDTALVKLILSSSEYNPHHLIWLTNTGLIRSLGSSFSIPVSMSMSIPDERVVSTMPWINSAFICTTKSDALIIHTNPSQECYSIITQGTLTELTSLQAHTFLKQYSEGNSKKGDLLHDYPQTQNYSRSQSHP